MRENLNLRIPFLFPFYFNLPHLLKVTMVYICVTDGPRNADLCSEADVEWGRTCRGWWDGGQHNPQLAPEYGGRRIPTQPLGRGPETSCYRLGPGMHFCLRVLRINATRLLGHNLFGQFNSLRPSYSILLSFWKFAKLSKTALSQSWTISARRP